MRRLAADADFARRFQADPGRASADLRLTEIERAAVRDPGGAALWSLVGALATGDPGEALVDSGNHHPAPAPSMQQPSPPPLQHAPNPPPVVHPPPSGVQLPPPPPPPLELPTPPPPSGVQLPPPPPPPLELPTPHPQGPHPSPHGHHDRRMEEPDIDELRHRPEIEAAISGVRLARSGRPRWDEVARLMALLE